MDFLQIAKELKPSDIPELSKNGEFCLWRELAEKFGVGKDNIVKIFWAFVGDVKEHNNSIWWYNLSLISPVCQPVENQ